MGALRTQRRWTEQDDNQLRELAKAGKSLKEISEMVGRSPGSVRTHAMLLSIAIARDPQGLRMKIAQGRRSAESEAKVSRAPAIAEDTILDALDGKWRTIAEIRTKVGRYPAVEVAATLEKMAEAGKIERVSEKTFGFARGKPVVILHYRLRSA